MHCIQRKKVVIIWCVGKKHAVFNVASHGKIGTQQFSGTVKTNENVEYFWTETQLLLANIMMVAAAIIAVASPLAFIDWCLADFPISFLCK